MKRLATLLLVALLLPLVACADSLISVSDLRDQVEASGGRWTQTYTSVRGETISVDVALNVPDVEAFPVLKTSWMPKLPDQLVDDYGPNGIDRTEPRWYAYIDRYGFVTVDHDWDFTLGKGEAGSGKKFSYPGELLPLDNLDWNGAYAFNNDLQVGEAYAFMKQVIQECYTRYGYEFYEPELMYIMTADPPLCNGVPIREKGAYTFNCYVAFHGIPLILSEGQGCNKVNPWYTLKIQSKDSYAFTGILHREIEMLHEDIPLLSFEAIKPVYEEMITSGLLREVFDVRLGYIAIYEDGKIENEVFRLIPCWVLYGEYHDSVKDGEDLSKTETSDYYTRAKTKSIVVNAQTGKLIPRDASNKENRKQFDIKTW